LQTIVIHVQGIIINPSKSLKKKEEKKITVILESPASKLPHPA